MSTLVEFSVLCCDDQRQLNSRRLHLFKQWEDEIEYLFKLTMNYVVNLAFHFYIKAWYYSRNLLQRTLWEVPGLLHLGVRVWVQKDYTGCGRLDNGPQRRPGANAWNLWVLTRMVKETSQMKLSKGSWDEEVIVGSMSRLQMSSQESLWDTGRGRFACQKEMTVRQWRPRLERHTLKMEGATAKE